MNVIISMHPNRDAKLLEYLSLIRCAAKYHRGLGCCQQVHFVVYQRQPIMAESVPSYVKEDIGVSNRDPHPRQVHLEERNTVLATTSTRVGSVLRTPTPLHTSVPSWVVEGITLSLGALPPLNPNSSHPQGQGNLTVNKMAPTIATSSFGGLVTPVNVLNLQSALSNHPNREFVNKLFLELRRGPGFATLVLDVFQTIYRLPL